MEWVLGSTFMYICGLPWSFLEKLIPETYFSFLTAPSGITIADPLKQERLWPIFLFRYLAFIFNLFILGHLLNRLFKLIKAVYVKFLRTN